MSISSSGVASIGNDPNWHDQGEVGAYWHSFSFGQLGETAKTRHELLTRLLPRLKIAGQCELRERFLVVRGHLRTYKIHLGSANILMEPNDKYLCIVRKPVIQRKSAEAVRLPFEGDSTLSVIISKAFLLAADDKIKDQSIRSQIKSER